MPKVSVIIPAYNHERFVKEAVESVLAQTFGDLEVCITDDCSTDGTADVVAAIRDDRVRFRRLEKNRGVSAAMNDAIARSSGEYVAVLNSDDCYLPDKTAIQVSFLEANPEIGAVFGLPAFVNEAGQMLPEQGHFYRGVFTAENHSRAETLGRLFFRGNFLCHPASMIRRRCHDEIGLYDERLTQVHDLDLWLRLLSRYDVHVLPEMLMLFRIIDAGGNASAPLPRTLSRTDWETERILRRYLDLDDTLFRDVFADEISILSLEGLPRKLQLGLIAAKAENRRDRKVGLHIRRFGLELLYEATPAAATPPGGPGFSSADLLRLSGQLDLYRYEYAARVNHELAENNKALAALRDTLGEGQNETRGAGRSWFSRGKNKA